MRRIYSPELPSLPSLSAHWSLASVSTSMWRRAVAREIIVVLTSFDLSEHISPRNTSLVFSNLSCCSFVVSPPWCLQTLSTCWWLLSLQLRVPSELSICVLNWAYFPLLHSCSLSSWVSSKAQILVLILDLPHPCCPHLASHWALSGLATESFSYMFLSLCPHLMLPLGAPRAGPHSKSLSF